ncbi:MAG: TetR/AcrR family transcriptional regulator, partial [Alphaproteobacteria bacterium]|nr:TetR/AcrR family transcriptional regulator [Alphaproteobacteria bacterium]
MPDQQMQAEEAQPKPRSRKHKTKKSIATRNSILEATLQCFIEIGYFRTTTTEIAKRADVTRGAVQYYFPTTDEVLKASVEYLLDQWLATYYEELRNMPETSNKFEHGIDTYWKFVRHPLFVAWRELVSASRTEPSLEAIIQPAAVR